MATTKLGLSGSEVTVANPNVDFVEYDEIIGASVRTLDGTLQTNYTATKKRWRVRWAYLTDAELTTLQTEIVRTSDLSWVPPSGDSTYTVHVLPSPTVRHLERGWEVLAEMLEV